MKITKQCLLYPVLILALFALFVACNGTKKASSPPTISDIQSSHQPKEQVKTGETVELYVDIENPSSIPLQFDWSVISGDGVLSPRSGSTKVTYQAPQNEGQAKVHLEVRDAKKNGIVATKTLTLQIIGEPSLIPVVDSSRYGFESGKMGWKRQTYHDSQAVTTVAQTTERADRGSGALKLTMDLTGDHPNNSKGEALIELRPPVDDLQGKTITAWIYAPTGSAGDFNRPNGVQVFVKDKNSRSLYGTWINMIEENWFKVSLTVNTTQPFEGYIDDGFDPQSIAIVGIKVAIGKGSSNTYAGPIYVDAVNW